MKSRKRLWIGVGAVCALAILVGWLARPEDELAGVMRFHPKMPFGPLNHSGPYDPELDFDAPVAEILAALPGAKREGPRMTDCIPPMPVNYIIELPDGRLVILWDDSANSLHGAACCMTVCADKRPWHQRAWSKIRYRLGL